MRNRAEPREPGPEPVERAAAGLFGDRLPLAVQYASLLAGAGIERGLIGPREGDRLWERHLINSAALALVLQAGARVLDLGSGAGLPGVPIAIARPDVHVTLLEPMERRVAFLREVVADIGLANVEVCRGRADGRTNTDGPPPDFDVVVCRAVAPLARLVEWALPLAPQGVLLALKGANAPAEIAEAEPVLRRLGVRRVEVLIFPWPGGDGDTRGPQVLVARGPDGPSDRVDVEAGMRAAAVSGMLATAIRVDLADMRTGGSPPRSGGPANGSRSGSRSGRGWGGSRASGERSIARRGREA